jgi:hypothetical protein
VSCTCCSPPRRFVGTAGKTAEEWLARHAEGLTVGRAAREAVNAERRRKSYAKQAGLTTRPSAGPRPEGHSLDRIRKGLGYKPSNVKWSDAFEQGRNRRTTKLTEAAKANDPPAT